MSRNDKLRITKTYKVLVDDMVAYRPFEEGETACELLTKDTIKSKLYRIYGKIFQETLKKTYLGDFRKCR